MPRTLRVLRFHLLGAERSPRPTRAELESFPAVRSVLTPDIDLNGDVELDGISVGLGLSAVQVSSFFD